MIDKNLDEMLKRLYETTSGLGPLTRERISHVPHNDGRFLPPTNAKSAQIKGAAREAALAVQYSNGFNTAMAQEDACRRREQIIASAEFDYAVRWVDDTGASVRTFKVERYGNRAQVEAQDFSRLTAHRERVDPTIEWIDRTTGEVTKAMRQSEFVAYVAQRAEATRERIRKILEREAGK